MLAAWVTLFVLFVALIWFVSGTGLLLQGNILSGLERVGVSGFAVIVILAIGWKNITKKDGKLGK